MAFHICKKIRLFTALERYHPQAKHRNSISVIKKLLVQSSKIITLDHMTFTIGMKNCICNAKANPELVLLDLYTLLDGLLEQ